MFLHRLVTQEIGILKSISYDRNIVQACLRIRISEHQPGYALLSNPGERHSLNSARKVNSFNTTLASHKFAVCAARSSTVRR